ncbi:MAG: esterase-like activity of phytase family protein [Rhodobacteraceae bacterium]|nr:esterase-like activity of phytase family protein [Paracoccaceae bacterium]
MRFSPAVKLIFAAALAMGAAMTAFAAARLPAGEPARAVHLSSFEWHPAAGVKANWFGGFSALELSADGRSMVVMTDRSHILTADIQRSGDMVTGIRAGAEIKLRSSKGRTLIGRVVDSEGLAVTPSGEIYVSFEGVSRVARHRKVTSKAEVLPRPQSFRTLPLNKALEALAIDKKGHLYTMPERAFTQNGDIPVFRWDGRQWSQPFTLPARGRFLPVGADFGPDGRFYLLERDFTLLGFRSRLRRWELKDGQMASEETLFQTAPSVHDNLEGVSVWRDSQDRLRATMISDDNFNAFQTTELVEYVLPD